jgi:hypothetical protein
LCKVSRPVDRRGWEVSDKRENKRERESARERERKRDYERSQIH